MKEFIVFDVCQVSIQNNGFHWHSQMFVLLYHVLTHSLSPLPPRTLCSSLALSAPFLPKESHSCFYVSYIL